MKVFADNKAFYRANLHTHTTCSDGKQTPAEAMALYRGLGYDILAITDHRKVTQPDNVPEGLLILPGLEMDYMLPAQAVHILGIGVDEAILADGEQPASPQEAVDAVNALGGCAILAHPAWSLNTTEFIVSLKGVTASEVWNSVSNIPFNAMRADSSSLLDTASANGQVLPMVASDDTHAYDFEIAQGWTMIQAEEKTVPAVIAALKAGRFYATQGPSFHQIEMEEGVLRISCSAVDTIIFYSNTPWVKGRTHAGEGQTGAEYIVQPKDTFVRCQIIDKDGRSAWSSPIRVK